ncbi:Nucleotide-binding universal stress protein, UspA family [Pricia antarctica]|uniref:Nucleotide-binding universal stress protein, UspA family n=1 Tax=Pricia antarctica TaxID=641691 RepID=A0A1G7DCJ2_9FLAO|nr:universal stress protein [Pricia antarctica]SDE48495.1 Nucleotide-binding universal stress protein, UspA family [Pricia antarctica]
MNKISTILVPFDFSKSAKRALEYAVAFVGRDDDIQIVLAHISGHGNFKLDPGNFTKLAEKYGRALRKKLEWTIQGGSVTQALLDIQKTKKIDLVIMGTLGTNKEDSAEQTNTSKLVMEADCPVLMVPKGYQDFQMKRIALVLGKEEIDDTQDLGALLEVARRFNAKVHVVTIKNRPGSYGYSEEEEKNEKAIEYYLENFYSERVFINNEDVVDGILAYAENHDIDLVAILPRNHAKRSEPSAGQLTQLLTLHSTVAVLAID